MIDLEKLQEAWEKDSKIDMDNLHTESTNIPSLHAKYFEMYNTIFLMRKKAEQQRKNIRHERYEYFSGKADPDVYVENPFPKKIRDKDNMQKYPDADDKGQIKMSVIVVSFCQGMIHHSENKDSSSLRDLSDYKKRDECSVDV